MSHSYATIRRQAERLLQSAGVSREPVSLRDVVSALNLEVVQTTGEPFQCEGALQPMGDGHAIVVRGASNERRRRFTIAHEIGHFVLHPGRLAPQRGGAVNEAWRQQEREADQFAAELLMPELLVGRRCSSSALDPTRLADRFDVSRQAMQVRLSGLGIATSSRTTPRPHARSFVAPLPRSQGGASLRRCHHTAPSVPPFASTQSMVARATYGRAARSVVAALVQADEPARAAPARPPAVRCARRARRRRRARARAARAAGRGPPRPGRGPRGTAAARPRRSGPSTRAPAVRRARCPGPARARPARRAASRRRPGTAARASGRTRPGARRQQQHAPAHAGAARRQPRGAGLGEQPLAGGDGVPPAVRPHLAAALAVAAEVERQRGQPGGRGLLAHQLVVLLAAAGAVAHEQCAARRARPGGRAGRPARCRRRRS